MEKQDFLADDRVFKFYYTWINSPTLFGHPADERKFYKFVKSCVEYVKGVKFVKKDIAWKRLDIDVLKAHLYKDLEDLRKQDYSAYQDTVHEIIVKFEMLIEYEKTKLFKGYQ